eukprot:Awhi_evm2s1332
MKLFFKFSILNSLVVLLLLQFQLAQALPTNVHTNKNIDDLSYSSNTLEKQQRRNKNNDNFVAGTSTEALLYKFLTDCEDDLKQCQTTASNTNNSKRSIRRITRETPQYEPATLHEALLLHFYNQCVANLKQCIYTHNYNR